MVLYDSKSQQKIKFFLKFLTFIMEEPIKNTTPNFLVSQDPNTEFCYFSSARSMVSRLQRNRDYKEELPIMVNSQWGKGRLYELYANG